MDAKQKNAIQWISSLKEYAKENKMPSRIIDGIEECEKELNKKKPDWENLSQNIDSILESIRTKTETKVEFKENGQTVTIDQIKNEMKKMSTQCRRQNEESIDAVFKIRREVIQTSLNQMKDMEKTEAHYRELTDSRKYEDFYSAVKRDYDRDLLNICKDMIASMMGNYSRMMESLRTMLHSLNGAAYQIAGNETFYHEHDEQKNRIENTVIKALESEDTGGDEIPEFGRKTEKEIKKIVKKSRRKKLILCWLPVIALILFIGVKSVVSYEKNIQIIENSKNADTSDDTSEMVQKIVEKYGTELLEAGKVVVKNSGGIMGLLSKVATFLVSLLVSFALWIIVVVLIIAVLYAIYIGIIKKMCKKQACKRCGEYISKQFAAFEKENHLFEGQENLINRATEELERQYSQIMDSMFGKTVYGEGNHYSHFLKLKAEWEDIR